MPSVLVQIAHPFQKLQTIYLYSSENSGINDMHKTIWTEIVEAKKSEINLVCASSPNGLLHAVANYKSLGEDENWGPAVTVFSIDRKWVGHSRFGNWVYESSKKFEFFQPNVEKRGDIRAVLSVCWSPDGKFISALFAGEPSIVTWFVHSQTVLKVWKQEEIPNSTISYVPLKDFKDSSGRLVTHINPKSTTAIPKFKTYDLPLLQDWFRSNYNDEFRPPKWNHDFRHKDLPNTRVYCLGGDDLDEVRQCVVQRDLVNLANSTIVRLPKYKKSGYQQLWDENYLSGNKGLPPNFALYTYAPIITKEVFKEHQRSQQNTYNDEVIKAGAKKRHIINLIGYAFDSIDQPDYKYFKIQSERNYSEFKKEFVTRLTNTLDYAFVCAQDLELKTIVLAFVGGGVFKERFPIDSSRVDYNTNEKAYTKCFQEALRNSIAKIKETTGKFELKLEYAAYSNQSVFDGLNDLEIQYLAKIPDAFFTPGAEDKLFVNAWDPHSHAGNEHNECSSLDAFMGRCSAISYLSNAELNPSLADISSYRVVRPTSFSWESVVDHKEKFNQREFEQNIRPYLQDMYGGNAQAKTILEDRKKVETVFFVKDLCGDPVRFLILLLRHGLIEIENMSYDQLLKGARNTLEEAEQKGYNFTWSSLAETNIGLELVGNPVEFLASIRWSQRYEKVALLLLGNLLFDKNGETTDLSKETLVSRIEPTHAPDVNVDHPGSVCGISAEYLLHLIILHLQASGREKNQYIFLTEGNEEKQSLPATYTSDFFSPPRPREDVLSMFYEKAIQLPFQFKNGLDVLCQRKSGSKHFHPKIEQKFQEFLEQKEFKADFFTKDQGLTVKQNKQIIESIKALTSIHNTYKKKKQTLSQIGSDDQELLKNTIKTVLKNLPTNPLAVVTSGEEGKVRGAIEKIDGQIFTMDRRTARKFDPDQQKAHMEDDIDWSLLILNNGRLSVTTKSEVILVPTYFQDGGKEGDFSWMIEQPIYKSHFFIYNDNQEQYLNTKSQGAGGGNAIIRPYRYKDPPRAFGIPTGSARKGYSELSDENKKHIDNAIRKIHELCMKYGYTHVHYSATSLTDQTLGTSIFSPAPEVKKYITEKLHTTFKLAEQTAETEKQQSGDCAIM